MLAMPQFSAAADAGVRSLEGFRREHRAMPHHPSIWREKDGSIEPIHDWQDGKVYKVAHSGT